MLSRNDKKDSIEEGQQLENNPENIFSDVEGRAGTSSSVSSSVVIITPEPSSEDATRANSKLSSSFTDNPENLEEDMFHDIDDSESGSDTLKLNETLVGDTSFDSVSSYETAETVTANPFFNSGPNETIKPEGWQWRKGWLVPTAKLDETTKTIEQSVKKKIQQLVEETVKLVEPEQPEDQREKLKEQQKKREEFEKETVDIIEEKLNNFVAEFYCKKNLLIKFDIFSISNIICEILFKKLDLENNNSKERCINFVADYIEKVVGEKVVGGDSLDKMLKTNEEKLYCEFLISFDKTKGYKVTKEKNEELFRSYKQKEEELKTKEAQEKKEQEEKELKETIKLWLNDFFDKKSLLSKSKKCVYENSLIDEIFFKTIEANQQKRDIGKFIKRYIEEILGDPSKDIWVWGTKSEIVVSFDKEKNTAVITKIKDEITTIFLSFIVGFFAIVAVIYFIYTLIKKLIKKNNKKEEEKRVDNKISNNKSERD